ncbi:hypothetical protein EG68_03377 [Paragonimus skrjabini miyazakii]|uniref:Uncharacterized protein n=1 Tax=Paragonimus skrjabini miyazakii TaxID=59628 RepID=A0A8S9YX60_9TREM|nr:hypothetical protein EG68_03377 [Paragonimus skrjabini miyazakii]
MLCSWTVFLELRSTSIGRGNEEEEEEEAEIKIDTFGSLEHEEKESDGLIGKVDC